MTAYRSGWLKGHEEIFRGDENDTTSDSYLDPGTLVSYFTYVAKRFFF
jgi:hypothetical protein